MGCKCFQEFCANLSVTISYLKFDLIKRQRSFKIGLISIFLVVFFLTIMLNAIQLCPSIFLKLSEEQSGEIDLIFTPSFTSKNVDKSQNAFDKFFYNKSPDSKPSAFDFGSLNFLNFDEINEKLKNLSFIEGLTPRWIIQGKASKGNTDKKTSAQFTTNVFIINSEIENNIGIGRELSLLELKKNECYISSTLANVLKLNEGDDIQFDISLGDMLKAFKGGDDETYEEGDQGEEEEEEQEQVKNGNTKNFRHRLKSEEPEEDEDDIPMKDDEVVKSNKFKKIKNIILNSSPVKDLMNQIINKYISQKVNISVDDYFKELKVNDYKSFSIKKSHLNNDIIKDAPIIKKFKNLLFDNEMNTTKQSENLFDALIRLYIKDIFLFNETSDLITINRDLINILSNVNISNYLKYGVMNSLLFEQFDPSFIIDNITQFLNFRLDLKIKHIVKSDSGKWPSASGNVLAMDSRHIKDYLYSNAKRIVKEIVETLDLKYMEEIILNFVEQNLQNFEINKFALTVNAVFKDKFNLYKLDSISMRHYISDKAEEITKLLGENYNINIQAPIYETVSGIELAKLFLEVIFIGIMFFLYMLCILLVYSLMLGNVDERTYEFGMLRSLGFKKNNLILLILIQGFIFAIPGTLFGLIASYIVNNFIAFLFNWYSVLVMPFFLSSTNIIFGIATGLSIPLISSFLPIKKSLEDNLRETLAIFNKKIGDITVSIIKLENLGISPTTLVAAITLISIGLLTYYFAPLSFLNMNFTLLLLIMIIILIIMLLGLIILTQLIVPYLQKLILNIIMLVSCKDRKLKLVVQKNLEGHKRRNQQVSIMFMVALGFVIFSGCTLNLVMDFVETLSKGLIGGDFCVVITDSNGPNVTLNEIALNNYFDNVKINYPDIIQNYAYISWGLEDLLKTRYLSIPIRTASISGYPIFKRKVIALDKNFLDSTYTSLYTTTQYDEKLNLSYTRDGKVDIVQMLYNNPNVEYLLKGQNNSFIYPGGSDAKAFEPLKNFQLNLIAAEGVRKIQAISVDNPAKLILGKNRQNIPGKVVALASKLPGILDYSSYETIARRSEIFISMTHMKELIDKESKIYRVDFGNNTRTTVDGVRKRQLILKYNGDIETQYKDMIYLAINNYIGGFSYFSIQIDDIIKTSTKVKLILGNIFLVLGIIALILSFFLIWTSFYSNIRENITEYGIMRSIGITKAQSIRIYLYEAATIIITSIIIGTFIGIVISSSLILQFDVFLELPFVFNFPFALYFILIILGLILGLLGSYYPTYAVNTLSLVKIMKGFNE